jgi:hypothetical protein
VIEHVYARALQIKAEVEYDSLVDALVIRIFGTLLYDDLPQVVEQVLDHPAFRTNINQLFDCTEGELGLSTRELEQIADDFTSMSNVLGLNRRLALLVSRTVHFGMMRQYEVHFSPGPEVHVRTFNELHAARTWLQAATAPSAIVRSPHPRLGAPNSSALDGLRR